MPPRSRNRGLPALVNVDEIRRTAHVAATTALTDLIEPDAILRAAATMVADADKILKGSPAFLRRALLLSLVFYTDFEGVARAGAVTQPTLDGMRRTALGLPKETKLPTGEAAATAARAAGVEEIPADLVLAELPKVVEDLVAAVERRKTAVMIRQDASLTLHEQGKTDQEIAALAGVAPGRTREELVIARRRLNPTE